MALTWQWNNKCGEAVVRQEFGGEVKEYTKTLYEGNAFLIFLNEWNEDGVDKYSLYTFFADEAHAKICLGLDKKKGLDNILDDGVTKLIKLRINKKKCRQWRKVVTLFAQAFDNLEIEIFTEEEKDD